MNRNRRSFTFVLLLAVAATGFASAVGADAPPPKKVATVEGITEYRLDNGLRLLLFPDASRPTVTVAMTVFVGSRHEGYGETGMAHLLEHMLFKGTPTHPRVDRVLRERGAQYNGSTWYDRTNYYETLPASDENLEFAIRFEADRLMNCFVRREDLLSEMTVVRNEFERGENSPTSILNQRIWATAYEWHNYGKETIGNRSDIERVPIENLQDFYRKHYQPDNAMVVVAGKFDAAKALKAAQESFGAIPKPKRKLSTTYTDEPPQDGERIVTLRRVGDVGNVGVAYHIPSGRHPDFAALDVLSTAITSQPYGKLYKLLVESKKAASVSGNSFALHDPGLVTFTASVRRDGSLESVRDLLVSTLEAVGRDGLPKEDIERAKRELLTDIERQATNTTRFAVSLSEWAAAGDWRLFFLHRDRLEKVTPDNVKSVAAKYLQRNNRTVGMYIPTEKPERLPIPSAPSAEELVAKYTGRAGAAEGEVFDPAWANVEARTRRVTLPSGAKLALLPKKTRGQEVHLQMTLKFGDEESLKAVRDALPYVAPLMLRGTKRLTYEQLNDELEKHQIELRPGFADGVGTLTLSMRAKRDRLPAGLDLLRQVLREPSLPEDQLELLKTQRLALLERSRSEPQVLSMIELQRRLRPYGKDDVRFTLTMDERIDRLRGVTISDVRKAYQEFLGGQNAEVSIVGDFDAEATLKTLDEMLGGWKADKSYARVGVGKPSAAAPGRHSIATPDKANANYMAGVVIAMRDDDPDYPALRLACYALGTGPGSRLWDRVREKEGLSYGVAGALSASSHDREATLRFQAIANPENMAKVEKTIREEIDLLLKEGIGAEELAKVKRGYLQASQLQRASDNTLAGILLDQLDSGRTSAFSAELEKKIEALTAEQVSAAFRKHVDPEKLVTVVAGDFGKKK
jgi:zinc protease